jgi:hypothetical protein
MNSVLESLYAFTETRWSLLVSLVIFIAAIELGDRISRRRPGSEASQSRSIASSILMLLALILNFIISEAAETYRETLRLMLKETDSIAETWRRGLLLEAPERERVTQLIREYMDVKLRVGHKDPEAILAIHRRIWEELREEQNRLEDSSSIAPLIASANTMMDLHWRTDLNTRQHPPLSVALLSIGGIVLVSVLVGYSTGSAGGHGWVMRLVYLGLVLLTLNSIRILGLARSGISSEHLKNQEGLKVDIQSWN